MKRRTSQWKRWLQTRHTQTQLYEVNVPLNVSLSKVLQISWCDIRRQSFFKCVSLSSSRSEFPRRKMGWTTDVLDWIVPVTEWFIWIVPFRTGSFPICIHITWRHVSRQCGYTNRVPIPSSLRPAALLAWLSAHLGYSPAAVYGSACGIDNSALQTLRGGGSEKGARNRYF